MKSEDQLQVKNMLKILEIASRLARNNAISYHPVLSGTIETINDLCMKIKETSLPPELADLTNELKDEVHSVLITLMELK